MTNYLRAILHGNPLSSIADVNGAVDNALATTMYAVRAAAQTTYEILNSNPAKQYEMFKGPYTIDRVINNGTGTIIRNNNVTERINVRRIKPYRQATTIV